MGVVLSTVAVLFVLNINPISCNKQSIEKNHSPNDKIFLFLMTSKKRFFSYILEYVPYQIWNENSIIVLIFP